MMVNSVLTKIGVLVGPSGVGKSTLIERLRESGFKFADLVSHTTRPMRYGEVQGRDYYFISVDQFKAKEVSDAFIISTFVHGNWYGVEKIALGSNIVCSLNVEAANKFKTIYGSDVTTIFIAPPSVEDLEQRLRARNSDDIEALNRRLKNARFELTQQDNYDYKVVNRDLSQAVREVAAILQKRLLIKHHVTSFPSDTVQRMMSYNIRMAPCAEDEGTENSWEHRVDKIQAILDHYRPDIIGVQEISEMQTKSIHNYTILAKYPSRKPFELGLAIAYQADKLEPLSDLRVVWLNELKTSPDSQAWDGSAYERFLIYAKFKSRSTGDAFWFMTTHFDHLGVKARQESAKIVMDLAESLDAPAVISGDFNCFPQLGGSELYKLLANRSTQLKDTGISAERSFGPLGSWRGWDYDPYMQRSENPKYDYLFAHKSIKVLQHGVIDDCVWDEHFGKPLYPSDHLPVISDIILRSPL